MHLLQQGLVPAVLISGGSGHSTVHLYESIRRHPLWRDRVATPEGRHEAEVLRSCHLASGQPVHDEPVSRALAAKSPSHTRTPATQHRCWAT